MDAFKVHEHGFIFTGDPRLLNGADNAGLDFFSLANNHFGNGGVAGVRDIISHLDELGIGHAGAGLDIKAAATPAHFDVGQTRVAVVSCTDLGGFRAGEDRAGMLNCRAPETMTLPSDVAQAIVTLSQEGTHWMTGNVIGVDGGELIGA